METVSIYKEIYFHHAWNIYLEYSFLLSSVPYPIDMMPGLLINN